MNTAYTADLFGSNRCVCQSLDLTGTGNSPVFQLCRKIVAAGHDPTRPLKVYRNGVLALHIRSVGEGAELEVTQSRAGRPIFRKRTSGSASHSTPGDDED
jgi:hypothetical protein